MSVELDLDNACGVNALGFDPWEDNKKEESQSTHFHKLIFSPSYYATSFEHEAALAFQTQESLKAGAAVIRRLEAKIMEPEAGARVDAYVKFGPGGPNWGASATGRVGDGNGNQVDDTVSYDS